MARRAFIVHPRLRYSVALNPFGHFAPRALLGIKAVCSLLLCLCVIGFCLPAYAARFSGDYLLQVCASDKNGKEITPGGHIACQAYIAGILDYHNLLRSMNADISVDFCVPDTASLNEIQSKVTSHIFRNRHEQGPFIASPSVAMALFMAYPCEGKKAKR